MSWFSSVAKFQARSSASLFAQAWENLLWVELGLSLTKGSEQGCPNLVHGKYCDTVLYRPPPLLPLADTFACFEQTLWGGKKIGKMKDKVPL